MTLVDAARAIVRRLRGPHDSGNSSDQLRRLLAVLDGAVELRPIADSTVRACGAPGEVPGEVGRTCGELVTAYQRLRAELRTIELTAEHQQLGEETARLLAYHQWLVRSALTLAFSITDNPRREPMRRRLTGLGAPGERLAVLHAWVSEQLTARG